jgi:hypothetical protein
VDLQFPIRERFSREIVEYTIEGILKTEEAENE